MDRTNPICECGIERSGHSLLGVCPVLGAGRHLYFRAKHPQPNQEATVAQPPVLSEAEREAEIVHAYLKDKTSIQALVQRFNLTGPPAVYAILRRAQLESAEVLNTRAADPGPEPLPKLEAGIRDDFYANMSIHQIRAKYGIGFERVREIIAKLGLERNRLPRGHSGRKPATSAEPEPQPTPAEIPGKAPSDDPRLTRELEIIRQYKSGVNTAAIQDAFDISPGQLYRALAKHGVKPTRAGREPASTAAELVGRVPVIDDPAITEAMAEIEDDEPSAEALAEMPEVDVQTLQNAPRGTYAGQVEPVVTITDNGVDVETRPIRSAAMAGLKVYRATRVITITETVEIAAADFMAAARMAQTDNAVLIGLELQNE